MKLIKIWLFMAMTAMALVAPTLNAATTITDHDDDLINNLPLHAYGLHGNSASNRRFMVETYKQRGVVTCDKVPRVCMAKDSMGPDCCKKKCVDTWSDGYNCGWCGKRCKYSETCCDGKCVNVRVDNYHCGKCNNKCIKKKNNKKGSSTCVYGICSYA
ncbi:Stigma-specific protein Stig1 [Macleaya cordata]|uniref:Stigma-specific protein Stig1 n=1 Tax=Macleaya cordata TaxID=56857 RepID=A0A200QE73_MACCD|nr:Stigma-specific protein Stig1 [Macleaya cordata]